MTATGRRGGLVLALGEPALVDPSISDMRAVLGSRAPIAVWPGDVSLLRGHEVAVCIAGDRLVPTSLPDRLVAVRAQRGVIAGAVLRNGLVHPPSATDPAALLVGGGVEPSALCGPGDVFAAAMQQLTPGPATDRLLVAIVAASGVLATCDEVVAEVADDPARHGGGAYELDRVEALAAHPLAVELGIADTLWRRALSLRHLERVGESSRVALAAPVEHLRWVVARLTDQLTILESALPAAPDGDRLPALPEITEQGLEHQVAVLSDTISRLHAEALEHDRAISEQLLAKDEAIAWLQQVWTEKDKEIIALREEIEWLRGQRSVPERRKW